ncbi:MAG: HEAT repeat protein [Rhodothermales bacterium]|jgi:HEAT repeat protein
MILRLVAVMALLLLSSCKEMSVFERRYVAIPVPGMTLADYANLLEDKDPNLQYLALTNLLAHDAIQSSDKDLAAIAEWAVMDAQVSRHPKLRALGAFGGGQLDREKIQDSLVVLLADRNDAVRVDACTAAMALGRPTAAVVASLLRLLDDSNALVRLQATNALAVTGDRAYRMVTLRLIEDIEKRPRHERLARVAVLGKTGKDIIEGRLLTLVRGEDHGMVNVAATALGELEYGGAVGPILTALKDGRGDQETLVKAMAATKAREAREVLEAWLEDGTDILGKAGQDALAGAVIGAWDESFDTVVSRFESLACAGDLVAGEPALEAILSAIDDPPDTVTAADLAGKSTPVLLAALSVLAESPCFDCAVVAESANNELTDALLKLGTHGLVVVRLAAVYGIAQSGSQAANGALLKALDDKALIVQITAIQAIGERGQQAPETLRGLYAGAERFVPKTFAPDEPGLLLRQAIDDALEDNESAAATEARRLAEFAADRPRATRMLASVQLADSHAEAVRKFLVAVMGDGTLAQKHFLFDTVVALLPKELLLKLATAEIDVDLKADLQKAAE